MTFRVGITGGMGSGKTTVSQIFETLRVPVYKADDAAKRLMNEDENIKKTLIKNFGETTYVNGQLNRPYLAAQVFNNDEKLQQLNAIVHPATIKDGEEWMLQQSAAYSIKEAAIIFESGSHRYLDYIIGVDAPVALRILRSMKRNNLTQEEVKARMNQQMDDTIKMKLCDVVIVNDEQQALIPQVINIHENIIKRSLEKMNAIHHS